MLLHVAGQLGALTPHRVVSATANAGGPIWTRSGRPLRIPGSTFYSPVLGGSRGVNLNGADDAHVWALAVPIQCQMWLPQLTWGQAGGQRPFPIPGKGRLVWWPRLG